jgi:L-serine dehydratase
MSSNRSWVSTFDLFKIGIGPSSSHTVGPMVAALRFVNELESMGLAVKTVRVCAELFGSLALTGIGHATDLAILMGLCGEHPQSIDPGSIGARCEKIRETKRLPLLSSREITFAPEQDLVFHRNEFLPQHPNGLRFTAWNQAGDILLSRQAYSVGGGFVVFDSEQPNSDQSPFNHEDTASAPYPYASAVELLAICESTGMTISQVVKANELTARDEKAIADGLNNIWAVMKQSITSGCEAGGILPGGLGVRRRASEVRRRLEHTANAKQNTDPMRHMDWVTLFALAVNEENAAGGRVVTAPTNGAAGVIPAVLAYYERFVEGASESGIHDFLLTAAAIGSLYKRNASLSAAEMGCQGEVGVACSMAAAGLAAVMGGTPGQIENAAEIGMEHNLGLTCDPVAGLVQVPCIERNTMGAIKAINAARLAVLYGDGTHRVSLDRVIETMRQTGVDMQSKYKETSLGGLAVNVINC